MNNFKCFTVEKELGKLKEEISKLKKDNTENKTKNEEIIKIAEENLKKSSEMIKNSKTQLEEICKIEQILKEQLNMSSKLQCKLKSVISQGTEQESELTSVLLCKKQVVTLQETNLSHLDTIEKELERIEKEKEELDEKQKELAKKASDYKDKYNNQDGNWTVDDRLKDCKEFRELECKYREEVSKQNNHIVGLADQLANLCNENGQCGNTNYSSGAVCCPQKSRCSHSQARGKFCERNYCI